MFSHNCRVALLCNEISLALFVIRACIMALFPAVRPARTATANARPCQPAPLIFDSSEQIADVRRRERRINVSAVGPRTDDGRTTAAPPGRGLDSRQKLVRNVVLQNKHEEE